MRVMTGAILLLLLAGCAMRPEASLPVSDPLAPVVLGELALPGQPGSPLPTAGSRRCLFLWHDAFQAERIRLEIDPAGTGAWSRWCEIEVPARSGGWLMLPSAEVGPATSLRLVPATACRIKAMLLAPTPFAMPSRASGQPAVGWLQATAAGSLTIAIPDVNRASQASGTYELGADMMFRPQAAAGVRIEVKEPAATADFSVSEDPLSVVARDAAGNVWRLPKALSAAAPARGISTPGGRLVEASGILYAVPGDGGWGRAVPLCAPGRRIADFCLWQEKLVLAGDFEDCVAGRTICSADGRVRLWIGSPGDLRKLGRPSGTGMVWKNATVQLDVPSDPFLMSGYDRKTLEITNHGLAACVFTIEVDPVGRGPWIKVASLVVQPGTSLRHEFPAGFAAHWIRLVPGNDGQVSATFTYL